MSIEIKDIWCNCPMCWPNVPKDKNPKRDQTDANTLYARHREEVRQFWASRGYADNERPNSWVKITEKYIITQSEVGDYPEGGVIHVS